MLSHHPAQAHNPIPHQTKPYPCLQFSEKLLSHHQVDVSVLNPWEISIEASGIFRKIQQLKETDPQALSIPFSYWLTEVPHSSPLPPRRWWCVAPGRESPTQVTSPVYAVRRTSATVTVVESHISDGWDTSTVAQVSFKLATFGLHPSSCSDKRFTSQGPWNNEQLQKDTLCGPRFRSC